MSTCCENCATFLNLEPGHWIYVRVGVSLYPVICDFCKRKLEGEDVAVYKRIPMEDVHAAKEFVGISRSKAREILHDGTVHGHAITDRQRRYFAAVTHGTNRK
jgi:hypothetical protein